MQNDVQQDPAGSGRNPYAPQAPTPTWASAPPPAWGGPPTGHQRVGPGHVPPLPPVPPAPFVPPRPEGRRVGIGVVLVVALVVALLAGGTGLGVGLVIGSVAGGDDRDVARDPISEDGGDTESAADVLPQRLPELEAWVEDRVGAQFTTTPDVEALDDEEFEDALMEPSPDAGEPASLPADDYTSTVHALGLVPDVDEYEEFYEGGYASGVVGFYDSGTERLAVRGTAWTPIVEVTVVHELVHALQDQTVDLDAATEGTRLEDESYLALSAVIEGQATAVENDWLAEQDGAYQDSYWEAMSSGGGGGAYDAFAATMSWLPYDLGALAVEALEESASPAATLDALRAPPTTTEQLFDMPGWTAGEAAQAAPQDLPTPAAPADADLVDEGTLGIYVLALLDEDSAAWGYADEVDPISGWAGDRYATWTVDDETCTAVVVQMDDAESAAELADVLDPWTSSDHELSVDGSRLDLRACVETP